MDSKNIQPTFFATASDFRKWLEKNHLTAKELYVGYYKISTGKRSIQWSESVDQALCFGWIDGIRRSLGEESYCIRFTPRKSTSIWSSINIKKVEELNRQGLMKQEGLAAFKLRKEEKSAIYTYEKEKIKLSKTFEKAFKAHKQAWAFFKGMPLSYQQPAIDWVMSAKQEATRIKRLNELINDSEAKRKIKRLSYSR